MAIVIQKAASPLVASTVLAVPAYMTAADWLIDPDLSAVAGVPNIYWKLNVAQDGVVEMTVSEKTAADAAIAAEAAANDAAALSSSSPMSIGYRSIANQQIPLPGSFVDVSWDALYGHANTALDTMPAGSFTGYPVPSDGYYKVTASVNVDVTSGNSRVNVSSAIVVNSFAIASCRSYSRSLATGQGTLFCSSTWYSLSAGDVIGVRLSKGANTAVATDVANNGVTLEIRRHV